MQIKLRSEIRTDNIGQFLRPSPTRILYIIYKVLWRCHIVKMKSILIVFFYVGEFNSLQSEQHPKE